MKSRNLGSILVSFIFSFIFYFHSYATDNEKIKIKSDSNFKSGLKQTPVAVNDTFIILYRCDVPKHQLSGDVTKNDFIPENTKVKIAFVVSSNKGILSVGTNGRFIYIPDENFIGDFKFSYRLCDALNDSLYSDAEVLISIKPDYDCDDIPDDIDIDDDNDGIPDDEEGNGILDSDYDNIPNSFDIDSDNDGITDNIEWQKENEYVHPSKKDENKNGWDDAYDTAMEGQYYLAEDTDNNGIPDYLDGDADGDQIPDIVEGNDVDNDDIADVNLLWSDLDSDGLDDAFDTVSCWSLGWNMIGSNATLPDQNNNGIREWREKKSTRITIDPDNKPALSMIDTIFSFYPNPCHTFLNIHIPFPKENETYRLTLVSLEGKKEVEKVFTSTPYNLNVQNLAAGVKILVIETPHTVYQEKLIIN